jgi:hypothetical protein
LAPDRFILGADMPIFGAIGDSAPDPWGRALMRRTCPITLVAASSMLNAWKYKVAEPRD